MHCHNGKRLASSSRLGIRRGCLRICLLDGKGGNAYDGLWIAVAGDFHHQSCDNCSEKVRPPFWCSDQGRHYSLIDSWGQPFIGSASSYSYYCYWFTESQITIFDLIPLYCYCLEWYSDDICLICELGAGFCQSPDSFFIIMHKPGILSNLLDYLPADETTWVKKLRKLAFSPWGLTSRLKIHDSKIPIIPLEWRRNCNEGFNAACAEDPYAFRKKAERP